jgi:hypothetical protein
VARAAGTKRVRLLVDATFNNLHNLTSQEREAVFKSLAAAAESANSRQLTPGRSSA